ncbi:MAG: hypoxanthine phosphoribosyltransferase [Micrococcaceae bacterium]
MELDSVKDEIAKVLYTEDQIRERLGKLARQVEKDYEGEDLLIVGILKGSVMVVTDFVRELNKHIQMDWMAVSSYGSGTKSSGTVRILKDLDTDISGKHVLIVEDIVDSGLTYSWLRNNLLSRGPKSVEILTLLSKPGALKVDVDVKYIGFEIPNDFVIGYGLDYAEKYRNLSFVGILAPHVYK